MDKLKMETNNLNEKNKEKLISLFPDLLTEVEKDGQLIKTINIDKLKDIIGDYATNEEEVYELTWAGKQKSKQKIHKPINKTLRPIKEDSVNFENTENLYIEGDNFEVLKLLQESYLNKVKMIYIDPPYNRGSDFVYKDNFKTSTEEYNKKSGSIDDEGNKLFKNTTTNGRFHSDWISMMYERLVLARDLLKDDGVIFVSIDDHEVHNLRHLMDEKFGEENFISQLVWKKGGGKNDSVFLSTITEYILIYRKSSELNGFLKKKADIKNYKYLDKDGKRYALTSFERQGINYSSNLDYPIIAPDGTKIYPGRSKEKYDLRKKGQYNIKDWCWTLSKNEYNNRKEKGLIEFRKIKDHYKVYYRSYYENKEYPYKNFIDDVTNSSGDSDLKNIFKDKKYFLYPKSIKFLKKLLCFISKSKDNDIVLDFFSGSATTAHAVMELNAEDGGNRKFILVQLPEETKKDSIAYKDGYKNICEIGKERIRRAAKKIKDDNQNLKEPKDLSKIDFGFKVFRVDSSNMKDVYYNPIELKQTKLFELESNIKEDRTELDVLYQVFLDLAIPISAKVNEEKINNKTIFRVEKGDNNESDYLVACFSDNLKIDTIKKIVDLKPLNIVFKDLSFKDDSTKINAFEYIKNKLPNTTVRVI